jgi:hypothetical protein
MATQEVKVTVDQEAIVRAAAVLREAGKQLAETLERAESLGAEPWRLYPHDGRVLSSYVDDHNQVRHCEEGVPLPATWRKLYVEKRA